MILNEFFITMTIAYQTVNLDMGGTLTGHRPSGPIWGLGSHPSPLGTPVSRSNPEQCRLSGALPERFENL